MRTLAIFVLVAAIMTILAGCASSGSTGESASTEGSNIKIGFVVKLAQEPWFQTEWKFAREAAKEHGFQLIELEAKDGEKVISAIDNLAAQGAQGLIICTPDPKLGPLIVSKAKEYGMKLLTVDDRLEGPDGPLTNVHHLGISARDIGKMVGQALVDEMKSRGWNMSEVGAMALTVDELQTARERIEGAIEVLTANGFPSDRIFKTAWRSPHNIETAVEAASVALTRHPGVKKWIAFSSNDDGVLGFVRATESRGISAADVIGVGINGTSGVDDFRKSNPTGFFASVLLSPRKHGYHTAEMMYRWIKEGVEPPKETWTTGILITRENYQELMAKEGLL
ncbi:MAG: arabinose ABC transporter substrate-binding protein [Fimbriimonadales bacterium]|nr:arabinose ABC transporter substrate-binding protein [Fimbriimonadales bacterium]